MKLEQIKEIIVNYLIPYHPEKISIFGSYARMEQRNDSDIDVMVKFKNPPSLLMLIKMEQVLTSKLGINVDLITQGAINNQIINENIRKDENIIYCA